MDAIKRYIKKFLPDISDELVQKIANLGKFKKHLKGDVLVKMGQMPKNYFFLTKGIVRGYFIDRGGKIFTKNISSGIEIAGPLSSLIKQKPSNTIYDCLTNCEIYHFNYLGFLKLVQQYHKISILHGKVLNAIFLDTERRAITLSVLNASERYEYFKNRFPDIENLIPQYQIASYLNITNVQLSRIRRKMARQ